MGGALCADGGEGGRNRHRQRKPREGAPAARAEEGTDADAGAGSGGRDQGQQQRKSQEGGSMDQQQPQEQQQQQQPAGDPSAATDAPHAENLTLEQQLSRALSQLVGRHATDEELLSLLNPAVPVGVWRQGLNDVRPATSSILCTPAAHPPIFTRTCLLCLLVSKLLLSLGGLHHPATLRSQPRLP